MLLKLILISCIILGLFTTSCVPQERRQFPASGNIPNLEAFLENGERVTSRYRTFGRLLGRDETAPGDQLEEDPDYSSLTDREVLSTSEINEQIRIRREQQQRNEDSGGGQDDVETQGLTRNTLPIIRKPKRKRASSRKRAPRTEIERLEQQPPSPSSESQEEVDPLDESQAGPSGQQMIGISEKMVYHPCKSDIYAVIDGEPIRGVEYERSMAPNSRFMNAKDLSKLTKVTEAELVAWAGGEDKHIDKQEEAAKKFADENPVCFECAYCETRKSTLKELKKHTVGRLRSGDQRYLEVSCLARIRDDKISNPNAIGTTTRPLKFPWAYIVCTDPRKFIPRLDPVTGNVEHDFEIPKNIQDQWDTEMVDERRTPSRGRPRKR
ncbi:uncharacterized protein LOC128397616 [Panonychus citri]|uniref:uncharacterized protein LOC128397616 n=1 Tax=Panonychus citri TaxID=50023 RepID=UPI0023078D9D|nr:uncharacterized protein LOC128397616 [Panonychus citri]